MSIKVAVLGAKGRMGQEVVKAIAEAKDLELVASIDQNDDIAIVTKSGAQVAIDFTTPDSVMNNIEKLLTANISVVVGTTGFDDERMAKVKKLVENKPELSIRIVPNFSIGAILMMRFAKMATKFYESVEIIEYHHPNKVDAPSGTATRTAQIIAAERKTQNMENSPDATISDITGARGSKVDGISVHAVRMQGLVAHQEVIFGTTGENLTIRHDSFDRASFMPGVLLAVRNIKSKSGLLEGIDDLVS
jgi:4-hydroxy-tetrahydrodipicolinate reductase